MRSHIPSVRPTAVYSRVEVLRRERRTEQRPPLVARALLFAPRQPARRDRAEPGRRRAVLRTGHAAPGVLDARELRHGSAVGVGDGLDATT
jgi:hypothetical protein